MTAIARTTNFTLARAGTERGFYLRVTRWGASDRYCLLFQDDRIKNSRDALALREREPEAFSWTEKTLRDFHANNRSEGIPREQIAQ